MKPADRQRLFERWRDLDPHPRTELDYRTPFELLAAVLLSDGSRVPAACTTWRFARPPSRSTTPGPSA